jgi:hypothetical protein
VEQGFLFSIFMRRTVHAVTALLTVLFEKHITSCNNVFLKGYFLLATCRVFHPILFWLPLYQAISEYK